MAMAREYISRPISRHHTTMGPIVTHHVNESVLKKHPGMKTRTDKAPMSTGEYSSHIRKYERHLNGAGNRH